MILALLLFPLLSFAHIVQDDVSVTEKSRHKFKAVCEKLFTHDSPLIEIASGTVLDCMGKKAEVGLFCEKELAADPYYLRGYIDKETSEVVCISGKKVFFKYLCVKLSDKELCTQPEIVSCKFIQQKLAKRLDLVKASFTKNAKGIRQLSCSFESLPLSQTKNAL